MYIYVLILVHIEMLEDLPRLFFSCPGQLYRCLGEPVQNYLADFFLLRGYPPPNGKSFCQKTLSGNGGYPPSPLNRKSAKLFQQFFFLKGLKMMFLY